MNEHTDSIVFTRHGFLCGFWQTKGWGGKPPVLYFMFVGSFERARMRGLQIQKRGGYGKETSSVP